MEKSQLVFSEMRAEQIDGLWVYLSDGVNETYRRWQKHLSWVPNDVFQTVRRDKAQVSFIYNNGTRIGFLIHRIFWEEFSNRKYMHIWFAYLYPEFRFKLKEYLPQGLDYLFKKAKSLSCYFIEMDSLRDGWRKALSDFNMKPRRLVYRKEI